MEAVIQTMKLFQATIMMLKKFSRGNAYSALLVLNHSFVLKRSIKNRNMMKKKGKKRKLMDGRSISVQLWQSQFNFNITKFEHFGVCYKNILGITNTQVHFRCVLYMWRLFILPWSENWCCSLEIGEFFCN